MRKIVFFGMLFITACSTKQVVTTTTYIQNPSLLVNGKLFATVFQQKSAEYRALCFQAYNIARYRLDNYKPATNKPLAIITDLDETVLDNSSYAVQQGLKGKDYEPASWNEWTAKGMADTMPGSVSFLKYAASKGVSIFYITNREEKDKAGTLKNLKLFRMPNADSNHIMLRQNISSKEARRQKVNVTHEIVLMLGDNLSDFSILFDKKTADERMRNTNFSASDFGNRFIVLPNPVYGDWESVIYNYNKYTLVQKDSAMRSVLKP